MTQEEIQSFFSKIKNKRDKALFATIYHYGLRVTEATLIDLKDIDFNRNKISIKRVKGGVWGEKPLLRDTKRLIKAYLEESVKFYMGTDSDQLLNRNIPGYNLDMAAGIKYTIDISKEPGQRITILRIGGKKYRPGNSYKIAMNSYRASGGGGHLSAAGIIGPKTYYKSSIEIRNLLISYLEQGNQINPQPDNNWKIIGDQ